jgi:hypothetical protein
MESIKGRILGYARLPAEESMPVILAVDELGIDERRTGQ